jgi:hypothetical protein
MSFVAVTKNTMLDALTITQISAHTAFPGDTGASEVTGGTYARVAAAFDAAASGQRVLSAPVDVSIPAGTTVRWLGLWNGTTYLGYSPNAGVPKEFLIDVSTSTFTCLAHGFNDGDTVVVYGDTIPTGLTAGTAYYVVSKTTDTFQLAATSGGTAIDITTAGGTACVVSKIVEETYASAGTHTVATWTLALPN